MGVGRDVLVESIHISPALLFAHKLEPGGNHQIAGTGRGRIRHGDLTGIFRLDKVGPGLRLFQPLLLRLDRIEAKR
jgi:hypothetical protein